MKDLVIVQPYVPSYRVPFFEALMREASRDNVRVSVVAGAPAGDQAQRGDATSHDWVRSNRTRRISFGKRSFDVTSSGRFWGAADAVIVPLIGTSPDALRLAMGRRRPFGVWGHVGSYTSPGNPLDLAVERWMMRRSDVVLAYTAGGREVALAAGVEPGRAIALNNAVETTDLANDLRDVTADELEIFRRDNGLPGGPLVTFIGGLDSSKRIAFLAEAIEASAQANPSIHFVIAGKGVEAGLLNDAVSNGNATLIGHVSGKQKAALLRSSRAIVSPGRIGLLAVDALVAGLPIVTTSWPYHAPEVEYLVENESLFVSPDSPKEFAHAVSQVSERYRGAEDWRYPTLDEMVQNFMSGVEVLFGGARMANPRA